MSQATLGSSPYRNSDLFSGYYLEERVDDLEAWDCDEKAEAVFEELRELWEGEGSLVSGYNEDTLLGSWIDPVLGALGYDTIQETSLPNTGGYIDRVLYADAGDRRDAMVMKQEGQLAGTFGRACALLEAKTWDADFTARFSEERAYRDASHQVNYYLEHTPDALEWGVLTNGRKWRLYGTKDYATETYYEVDLPEILESGDLQQFKYFYLFFRPEAFREVGGSTFLETVWSESETAAQELGEDLQDNVFTALRVLGEGFVETNELDIDPEDEEARGELKEQSLVLLYRLMFVLYAESRHLIDPDDPDARQEYRDNFSLDQIRLDVHQTIESGGSFEDYSEHSHSLWTKLQDLFRLVDTGKDSLGVSAYNGGLFDRDEHEFLVDNAVSDRYIAEVVYRLGTTETDDGSFAMADYADLDTRHLGTIYEGLLEHEFRIAPEDYAAVAEDGGQVWEPATEVSVADAVETVERGELYVVNDEGERKATGAYYTPDYVVSYIVEETIDPLIEEMETDLDDRGLERGTQKYVVAFWHEITDLRVLDPAMGSGHFLTSATGYLSGAVMERVRELETATFFVEEQIRREISRECIYGVDLNGMAVELAKLSMWLETLAADQPLAFLDHHLKTGNSLVGSDISEVLADDDVEVSEGQLTFADVFAQTRQQALEHVMELTADLLAIDNETIEDAKRMAELYDEIREDDLYERLFAMANVHTAERFDLDVPGDAYERMARAVDDDGEWAAIESIDWYNTAQAMADDEQFFHWELEFPEVFFSEDGERSEGAGFDAVVGNPPYGVEFDEKDQQYLSEKYRSSGSEYDSYTFFMEEAISLAQSEGFLSYIVPTMWTKLENNDMLRRTVLSDTRLISILDTGLIFENAVVETLVFCAQNRPIDGGVRVGLIDKSGSVSNRLERIGRGEIAWMDIPQSEFAANENAVIDYDTAAPEVRKLTKKIDSQSTDFGRLADVSQGITPYDSYAGQDQEIIENRAYHSDIKEDDTYGKWLRGRDVGRYEISWGDEWLSYGDWLAAPREKRYFTEPRILFREVTGGVNRVISTYSEDELYYGHSVIPALTTEAPYSGKALLGIINSKLLGWYNLMESPNAQKDTFPKMNPTDVKNLPICDDVSQERQSDLQAEANEILELKQARNSLNLSLLDHLGHYDDGQILADIGFTQPPEDAADSILQQTAEQKPNLRVGDAEVIRESPSTVEIRLTARYKPDDGDAYETDQWGYTETEPLPALRITDLSKTEADLIEAFVPVAVEEAGGFAEFRETATKTNSLVDRLRKLTLPRVADVGEGLESYTETKERADELDAKVERTDELIDEIVYDLYGLTDEEIDIVEEAVEE